MPPLSAFRSLSRVRRATFVSSGAADDGAGARLRRWLRATKLVFSCVPKGTGGPHFRHAVEPGCVFLDTFDRNSTLPALFGGKGL